MSLTGMYTALITPFRGDEVDLEELRHLIERQIDGGVDGILLLGSTGETPTLTLQEQELIVRTGVELCKERVTLVVGCGTNCTRTTIERALWAQDLGADALLISTPYYNKPSQKGLYCHYEAISRAVSTPIVVYNNPGRTAVSLDPFTLHEIAELPNIVAVKEASGSASLAGDILHHTRDILLLSGDDLLTLPIMALGGHGLFSILANLLPKEMVALVSALDRGEMEEARRLHFELLPLFKATSLETNPMPIKEAMRLCGLPAGPCRLPLTEMTEPHRESLHSLIHAAGLVPATAR